MHTLALNSLQGYPTIRSNIGIANILEDINVRLHADIFAHSSE